MARKRKPFEDTTVSVERTQGQLRKLVGEWGGTEWGLLVDEGSLTAKVQFRIPVPIPGQERDLPLLVRISMPLPHAGEDRFHYYEDSYSRQKRRSAKAAGDAYHQEVRRRWRCLLASVKQRLINIDTEISDEIEEFGWDVVDPATDRTWREQTRKPLRKAILAGEVSWLRALPAEREGEGK